MKLEFEVMTTGLIHALKVMKNENPVMVSITPQDCIRHRFSEYSVDYDVMLQSENFRARLQSIENAAARDIDGGVWEVLDISSICDMFDGMSDIMGDNDWPSVSIRVHDSDKIGVAVFFYEDGICEDGEWFEAIPNTQRLVKLVEKQPFVDCEHGSKVLYTG